MKAGNKPHISPETLPLSNGEGRATLFRSQEDTDKAFVIASGFGAVPELYFGLAEELATFGFHAIVPDIVSPLKGEDPDATISYKARRLAMAVDALTKVLKVRSLELGGHSFGGVCAMESAELMPVLDALHLVSSVGFGGLINEGGIRVGQVPGFYVSEVLGATRHINRFLGASALKSELAVMANIPQRRRELLDIEQAHDYMKEHFHTLPIRKRVYVADRDHIIDPTPTRKAVEGVISIHPRATHFAPTTHGRHVAHLLAA